MTRHPFASFKPKTLRQAAFFSTGASLALGAVLLRMGAGLTTAAAPHGLASFELAWRPAALAAVLASWGDAGVVTARAMTFIDYGFLAAYGLSLASLSLYVPGASRFPRLASASAWAATLAAALDAVENAAGLLLLGGRPASPLCLVQAACAAPKFALAGLCLAWVAAGAFIRAPRD
ncbi:hypothetical protein EPO15_01490 [bacterium]|nr:MAG: hypothetical protein EPO15_01490 [bacterium]